MRSGFPPVAESLWVHSLVRVMRMRSANFPYDSQPVVRGSVPSQM